MQFFKGTLLALALASLASLAPAQLPTFKHIIIIVQENRTPDNIFGSQANGPMWNRESI